MLHASGMVAAEMLAACCFVTDGSRPNDSAIHSDGSTDLSMVRALGSGIGVFCWKFVVSAE